MGKTKESEPTWNFECDLNNKFPFKIVDDDDSCDEHL